MQNQVALALNAGALISGSPSFPALTTLGGTVTFTSGAGNLFSNPVVLSGNTVVDTGASGGAIAVAATIDASSAGGQSLTLNAGSGTITTSAALGGTTPLGAVTLDAGSVTLGGNLTTAGGAVTINAPLTVQGNVIIDSTDSALIQPNAFPAGVFTSSPLIPAGESGLLGFNGAAAAGANVTFNDAIAAADGSSSLAVEAGTSGAVVFNGPIGSTGAPVSISAGGVTVTLNGAASLARLSYFAAETNIVINAAVSAGSGSNDLVLAADAAVADNGTAIFGPGGSINWTASSGSVFIGYHPGTAGQPANYNAPDTFNVTANPGAFSTSFTIDSATDLQNVGTNLSASYLIDRPLDLSSIQNFTPIGTAASPFTGSIDGGDFNGVYTISNLAITSSAANAGLFGAIGSGATVADFILTNVNVAATGSSSNVGALAGQNAGTINDVAVASGQVSGAGSIVGGLVGINTASVQQSSAAATVNGTAVGSTVGGLVGENAGTVTGSYAGGTVTGAGGNTSIAGFVGGLVGMSTSGSTVTQSHAAATVTVGDRSYAGGLVGYLSGATVSQSYASGSVTGTANFDNIGGLVGGSVSGSTVTQSYATGAASGGGGSFDGGYIGGLVGYESGSTVSQSYATGSATVGNISSGNDFAGGLIGYMEVGSQVTQSYATGPASGGSGSVVGGLVGQNRGTVTQSYSTGTATGSGSNGGLVGGNTGSVATSYWDTVTSGLGSSAGGTGLTTTQTASQASYDSSWSFASTWYLIPGMAHPILRSELVSTLPIVNAHQLELIGQNTTTLAASYTLGANIDMSAELANPAGPWLTAGNASIDGGTYGFVPIGSAATPFTGVLSGQSVIAFTTQSFTINGLAIHDATDLNVGLFGTIGSAGQVEHLALTNVSVTGSVNSAHIGALVGQNNGSVFNSSSAGTVSGTGTFDLVGGLIGRTASSCPVRSRPRPPPPAITAPSAVSSATTRAARSSPSLMRVAQSQPRVSAPMSAAS